MKGKISARVLGKIVIFSIAVGFLVALCYYTLIKPSERKAYVEHIEKIIDNYNNSQHLLFEEHYTALTDWEYSRTVTSANPSPSKRRLVTPKNGPWKGFVFKQTIRQHRQGNVTEFVLEAGEMVKDGKIVYLPIRREK